MSDRLMTVEQAAERLNLHPKTVLRYIRDGRLEAKRIGKAYRIAGAALDAFSGLARGAAAGGAGARATCILELPGLSAEAAERVVTLLHAAAMTGDSETPPLHLETAFDPSGPVLKVVLIGAPSDIGRLLEMVDLHVRDRR